MFDLKLSSKRRSLRSKMQEWIKELREERYSRTEFESGIRERHSRPDESSRMTKSLCDRVRLQPDWVMKKVKRLQGFRTKFVFGIQIGILYKIRICTQAIRIHSEGVRLRTFP